MPFLFPKQRKGVNTLFQMPPRLTISFVLWVRLSASFVPDGPTGFMRRSWALLGPVTVSGTHPAPRPRANVSLHRCLSPNCQSRRTSISSGCFVWVPSHVPFHLSQDSVTYTCFCLHTPRCLGQRARCLLLPVFRQIELVSREENPGYSPHFRVPYYGASLGPSA